jgi:hypothetical protein
MSLTDAALTQLSSIARKRTRVARRVVEITATAQPLRRTIGHDLEPTTLTALSISLTETYRRVQTRLPECDGHGQPRVNAVLWRRLCDLVDQSHHVFVLTRTRLQNYGTTPQFVMTDPSYLSERKAADQHSHDHHENSMHTTSPV